MALSKTLAQIKSALLVRAGMNTTGTSVDLTATVLDGIVNDAVYEAWDVIVGKWLDYFTTSGTLALIAGTASYAVPTLFYKQRLLHYASDGARILPGSLDDLPRFVGETGRPRRYVIMNRTVVLYPTPTAAENVTMYYVPIKAEMTSDSDTLTLDTPIELKYILATAWRDILDRQNLDPSPAIAKMQTYEAKLRTASDGVDATEPFYLDPRGPSNVGWDDADDEVW